MKRKPPKLQRRSANAVIARTLKPRVRQSAKLYRRKQKHRRDAQSGKE